MCYNVLQTSGGDKDGSQMIEPVGNRMCSPGLEEMEADSFRNTTSLYTPYILAGGGSILRHKKMNCGERSARSELPPSPFFQWCMFHSRYSTSTGTACSKTTSS